MKYWPLASLLFALFVFAGISPAHAQTAADLQSQIDQNNAQIAELDAEIAQYQAQVDALGKQKNTLQSAVNSLALSQKQLADQIQVTQNKIASANLQLEQLGSAITDKQSAIDADQSAIGSALRELDQGDQTPLIEELFSSGSFASAWDAAEQTAQFNSALQNNISDLASDRVQLSSNRDAVASTKSQLQTLSDQLATQKQSVDASKAAQQSLLTQTKDKESSYETLIAEKQSSEKSFEQELNDLQGQLQLVVHPGSIPKAGTGVLAWPFATAFMQNCTTRESVFGNLYCITQYFGNTPFATANPQIYNGMGHDGIDIAAPIGTPVQAAADGVIYGTGNTDLIHDAAGDQCYSFGKWVMIKHANGINTMYAHLSEIDVTTGQSVTQGQVIGLSGETGYATGPHLHFGVYASEGTEILTLNQFRGDTTTPCAGATMPVATEDAYLNPLSYL